MRRGGRHRPERALEADIEHLVDHILRHIHQRRIVEVHRIGYQNMQAAIRGVAVDRREHRLAVGDIDDDGRGVRDLARGGLRGLGIDVGDGDFGAG